MSTNADLITELRSAAATLRTPTGSFLPAQDRITAELIERAADALAAPQSEPEILSYDPTQARATITVRWPDGVCLGYDVSRTRYTDNLPAPAAPAWSEFPAWVNYIAMDSDGRWHGFGQKPYVEDSFGGLLMGWDVEEGGSMAYRDYNAPHVAGWRESLRERPEAAR